MADDTSDDETTEPVGAPDETEPGGPVVSPTQTEPAPDQPGTLFPSLLKALADVPHPDDATTLASAPQKVGSASRASITSNGVTPGGIKQARGLMGSVEAESATDRSRITSEAEQGRTDLSRGYQETLAAEEASTAANREHLANVVHLHEAARDFDKTAAEAELLANAHAKAEGEQYIAGFKQEMAGVRQLMMTPGNPLTQLGTGSKFAMAGAMFAQGFLGARGIKVDVTGQVDKWVDREVALHQQMIGNAKELANNQLTLYGLARQGANDEWEARQRLRSFVIDKMKNDTLMEADRWESESAKADAMAKAAKLDLEKTKTIMALQDGVTTKLLDSKKEDIAKYKAVADASVENRKASIGEEANRLAWAREKRLGVPKPVKPEDHIFFTDPFNTAKDWLGKPTSGGKRVRMIDPNAPSGIKEKAADVAGKAQRYYQEIAPNLDILDQLFIKAKPGMKGPEWLRNKNSPEYRQYQKAKDYLGERIVYDMTGAQANDAQTKRLMGQLDADNWSDSGSNQELISQFKDTMRRRYEATLKGTPGLIQPSKAVIAQEGEYEPSLTIDEPTKVLGEVSRRGDAAVPPGIAGKVYGEATNADSSDDAETPTSKALEGFYRDSGYGVALTARKKLGGMSKAEVGVEDLARLVLNPETYGTKLDPWGTPEGKESADEVKQEASDLLNKLADKSEYARYLRAAIQDDPDKARKLLER